MKLQDVKSILRGLTMGTSIFRKLDMAGQEIKLPIKQQRFFFSYVTNEKICS
jgi:hypothetical protein